MTSTDEREIRDAVAARLREIMPRARIVHELNVAGQGTNRIDVAAIDRQAIVGVEIKSKKDTLKRLADQWDAFNKCCHHVIVAAHEKHFAEWRHPRWRDDVAPYFDLNHPDFAGNAMRREHVWSYPRPGVEDHRFIYHEPWFFRPLRDCHVQPMARAMLGMLWAGELRAECSRHSVGVGSRATRHSMIHQMVWMMTGREICEAVCRQLRARDFACADEPIVEEKKPA